MSVRVLCAAAKRKQLAHPLYIRSTSSLREQNPYVPSTGRGRATYWRSRRQRNSLFGRVLGGRLHHHMHTFMTAMKMWCVYTTHAPEHDGANTRYSNISSGYQAWTSIEKPPLSQTDTGRGDQLNVVSGGGVFIFFGAPM